MNLFQILKKATIFSKMLNTVSENKDQPGPQSEEGHFGALERSGDDPFEALL
jgi:hypothetical protein